MKLSHLTENTNKLVLEALPYGITDLEPVMHRDVVKYHYSILSAGYVDRYNNSEGDPEFNRAGALLHNLWWAQLSKPKVNNLPTGSSKELIDRVHGDFDTFRDKFIDESLKLQGSGWCYLAKDGSISTLKNQSWKSTVIMPIDLWEHASNPLTLRKDYMKTIWRIINWSVINDRLNLG